MNAARKAYGIDIVESGDHTLFVVPGVGGLLLTPFSDLHFLNESAAFIWRLRLGGASNSEILNGARSKYDLSQRQEDVLMEALRLPNDPERMKPAVDSRYMFVEAGEGRYELRFDGRAALWFDVRNNLFRGCGDLDLKTTFEFVHTAAPKVYSALGYVVLHGSAFESPAELVFASGPSGAGKTTLARIARDAGCVKFAEDKILLSPDLNDNPALWADGERFVTSWVRRIAQSLSAKALTGPLLLEEERPSGQLRTPTKLLFLNESNRLEGSTSISLRAIHPADALERLPTQLFLGTSEREYIQVALAAVCRLVLQASAYDALVPAELTSLNKAVRHYISTTTG